MEFPNTPFNITIFEFKETSATLGFELVKVNAAVLSDEGVSMKDISDIDFDIRLGKFEIVGIYFTLIVAVTDFEK